MASTRQNSRKPLEIGVDDSSKGVVVRLRGSATMDHVDRLREQLLDLTTSSHTRLVVDMSELGFINSLGLGVLITAHLRCQRRGYPMCLVNPPPRILRILKVTRLTDLFAVFGSVDEAVKAT